MFQRINWNIKLFTDLWAYYTAYKVTSNVMPFQLVYGQKAILSVELEVQSLQIALDEYLGDMKSF